MIDLFGLGKHPDPHEPEAGPPSAVSEEAPRGSHKLWAFLLVLDSVFVIVFAGVVAAKVYQHWKTPAAALVPAPRKRFVKSVEAPVASTAPAPAPEPVKAPEPPKADDRAIGRASVASSSRQDATAPRPPKPSMLADAPKHRESPKPSEAGQKAAPAAQAPGGPVKAIKTEFKVHAPKAKSVELVGAFIVRGGRKEMSRQEDGSWTVTLYLNPGSYRYFFSVDKKKQLDPENPHSEKGASLLTIP